MILLKNFIEKALDYDLELPIVIDMKNGSSVDVDDIIECKDNEGRNIISIKFR